MATYRLHFRWTAPGDLDIVGYRLYVGRAAGVYTVPGSPVEMGNVTSGSYLVPDVTDRLPWYFALKAHDTELLESVFSNEVSQNFDGLNSSEAF